MYNGNFDITRTLDQSNRSTQRCPLIFWIECSVGGYLDLAQTIFPFVSLPLLTADIKFKFKRRGFCNILLIKWFSCWNMT
jgi:hypothetical protein